MEVTANYIQTRPARTTHQKFQRGNGQIQTREDDQGGLPLESQGWLR